MERLIRLTLITLKVYLAKHAYRSSFRFLHWMDDNPSHSPGSQAWRWRRITTVSQQILYEARVKVVFYCCFSIFVLPHNMWIYFSANIITYFLLREVRKRLLKISPRCLANWLRVLVFYFDIANSSPENWAYIPRCRITTISPSFFLFLFPVWPAMFAMDSFL